MARGRKKKSGDTRSFGQFKKEQGLPPANRNISSGTAGSGYQAGSGRCRKKYRHGREEEVAKIKKHYNHFMYHSLFYSGIFYLIKVLHVV